MRKLTLALVTLAALLGTTGPATAADQTLTLAPGCPGQAPGGYFEYQATMIVTGLGPWGPATGSVSTADGFELGPVGFSAGADGTARITIASIFPGVFTVRVFEPFAARAKLYVDCGRPLPVTRGACKQRGWRDWGFASRRECLGYVQAAEDCAYQHYHGVDVLPCPPRLPNE